ncbi:MAG: hypothetical protein MZV64_27875 [Ignavibacteriales bacterium]|nr:hypothetical protein [Ignavibacteriales bacterium]
MKVHGLTGSTILLRRRAGEERDLGLLDLRDDGQRAPGGAGADHRHDAVPLDEPVHGRHGLGGVALVVVDDDLELPAQETAGLVEVLLQHLRRVRVRAPPGTRPGPVTEKMASIRIGSARVGGSPPRERPDQAQQARSPSQLSTCPPPRVAHDIAMARPTSPPAARTLAPTSRQHLPVALGDPDHGEARPP